MAAGVKLWGHRWVFLLSFCQQLQVISFCLRLIDHTSVAVAAAAGTTCAAHYFKVVPPFRCVTASSAQTATGQQVTLYQSDGKPEAAGCLRPAQTWPTSTAQTALRCFWPSFHLPGPAASLPVASLIIEVIISSAGCEEKVVAVSLQTDQQIALMSHHWPSYITQLLRYWRLWYQ